MMKESIKLIGLAKARADNGFSQVGRTLDPADPVDRVLMLLASRAIATANAILLLSLNNHANEGLPLLRSLFEIAAHIRWIAAQDSTARAREFLEEHRAPSWDAVWSGSRLKERMKVLGFGAALEDQVMVSCYDHVHGNAAGLPWGHVFEENAHKGMSADDLLKTTAALMEHVITALDSRWPGMFPAAARPK